MNRKRFIGACLLAGLSFGCATNGPNETTITPERAEVLAQIASYAGTKIALEKDPLMAPQLVKARDGFCSLIGQSNWSLTTMAQIADSNGLDLFQSEWAVLGFQGGIMLVDLVSDKNVDLGSEPYARAVVNGVCRGMDLALGRPATKATEGDPVLVYLKTQEKATR